MPALRLAIAFFTRLPLHLLPLPFRKKERKEGRLRPFEARCLWLLGRLFNSATPNPPPGPTSGSLRYSWLIPVSCHPPPPSSPTLPAGPTNSALKYSWAIVTGGAPDQHASRSLCQPEPLLFLTLQAPPTAPSNTAGQSSQAAPLSTTLARAVQPSTPSALLPRSTKEVRMEA